MCMGSNTTGHDSEIVQITYKDKVKESYPTAFLSRRNFLFSSYSYFIQCSDIKFDQEKWQPIEEEAWEFAWRCIEKMMIQKLES